MSTVLLDAAGRRRSPAELNGRSVSRMPEKRTVRAFPQQIVWRSARSFSSQATPGIGGAAAARLHPEHGTCGAGSVEMAAIPE